MEEVGRLREVEGFENDPKMEELARFAIDEHNRKKNERSLELVKIANVNQHEVVCGMMYYMQLHALDTDEGITFLYASPVLVKSEDNSKEADRLILFREVKDDD
ncbi:cysteine proteinase inhibitor A-like [Humulus lupulus]|uniref:cysteine proteinase inhibitor A-like n=1 Tax=Humulus lupulus TaxID=3486 RepID=UPI002B40E408|nr:cysteine proteinase inhibitor A-like [Humulus lupulus]